MKIVAALVLLCLGVCFGTAGAQTTTETSGTPPAPADADVLLQADLHIDSLRFQTVPQGGRLNIGGQNERSGYTILRSNLPKQLRPGVTYRNVHVLLRMPLKFVDPNGAPQPRPSTSVRKSS